jgi:hypothetical protein
MAEVPCYQSVKPSSRVVKAACSPDSSCIRCNPRTENLPQRARNRRGVFEARTFRIRTANSVAWSGSCDLPRLLSLRMRFGPQFLQLVGIPYLAYLQQCSIGRDFALRTSFDSFAAC